MIGLRTWDGEGMVRLLDHDPASSSMLLERLDGARTLASIDDDDKAMGILAGLHARLVAVPAPQGLPGLGEVAAAMLEEVPQAGARLTAPADRGLLRGWASAVAELVDDPGDRLLHWDLHYDNVLAAQREPWLAIDPEPLVGDPGFDLWPALDSRWDDIAAKGEPLRVVRRRFDLLTDTLGLDRARAAGWTRGGCCRTPSGTSRTARGGSRRPPSRWRRPFAAGDLGSRPVRRRPARMRRGSRGSRGSGRASGSGRRGRSRRRSGKA